MPKNNKYKSGDSPEDDEQNMPSRFKELVDSESGPEVGDKLSYIVDVESEQEIPEDKAKAFTAVNRPDSITSHQILNRSAFDHIQILYCQIEELRSSFSLAYEDLRTSFGQEMARTRINELFLLLAQYGRDLESGIMKRFREKCFEDHQEIERLMEEIKGLPISENDKARFELACQFYDELIQVPGHKELVKLA